MLFDKILNCKNKKRKRNKTIRHKIATMIMCVLIFTYGISELIRIIFSHLKSPFNFLIGGIIFISYVYLISDYTANLLSFKFVHQVNRMTDLAKAIANSDDLKKRVSISNHEDELSNLEESLNSMLDKLQDSFEKQRRFVSDASHELRTPISIIQGYLDILDEWGKKDTSLLDESVKSMKEETYHMKMLIENLLFLARSDQGQLHVNYDEIELNLIIEKLIKDTRLIAKDKTIDNEINEPLIINGDRELILQMLRAIVQNSIKYTGNDGRIIINSYKENSYAVIDIIDNGIGIEQKNLDKIFERFYRVEEARSKDNGGSGLGLALVQKIINIHNGRINVNSEIGKGTKMSIYLPFYENYNSYS